MGKKDVDYRLFWREVTQDGRRPCALRGTRCHRCEGRGCLRCEQTGVIRCSHILDAHHFVPKRRLHTVAAKQDVRNGVPLCRDHHDLVEQGLVRCPRPPLLEFFLAEHDIPAHLVPEGSAPRPALRLVRPRKEVKA